MEDKNYQEHLDALNHFFQHYKINPKNLSIYIEAITHPSYANEHNLDYDYEKLEFLGDSAVSWIIANYLYGLDNLNVGKKAETKAKLISGKNFVKFAKQINLDKIVLVGKGFNGHPTDKIMEDGFEALMGAVAHDQGIRKLSQIINELILEPYSKGLIDTQKPYKNLIQEGLMCSGSRIKYIPINDPKEPVKIVRLVFDGQTYGIGSGHSLAEAEENASREAYGKLIK